MCTMQIGERPKSRKPFDTIFMHPVRAFRGDRNVSLGTPSLPTIRGGQSRRRPPPSGPICVTKNVGWWVRVQRRASFDRKTIFERAGGGPLPITFIVLWTVAKRPLADASGSKVVGAIPKLDSRGTTLRPPGSNKLRTHRRRTRKQPPPPPLVNYRASTISAPTPPCKR